MWRKYMQASSPMIARTVSEIVFKVVETTNPNKWSESIDGFRLRSANLSGNSSLKSFILFLPFVRALLSHLNFLAITENWNTNKIERAFSLSYYFWGFQSAGGGFESPLNDDLFRKDWEKVSRVNTGRGDGSSNGIPFPNPKHIVTMHTHAT